MLRTYLLTMLLAVVALVLVAGGRAQAAEPAKETPKQETPAKDKPASLTPEQLEKQFAETMTGAKLVGHFTSGPIQADKPLPKDTYTLGKVTKLKGDYWLIEARIQYGDHDMKLPLTLEVKWAGDTPVITLTDAVVPGFGAFTARVLVYRNQYAGTWSGHDHGGQMFGQIERDKK